MARARHWVITIGLLLGLVLAGCGAPEKPASTAPTAPQPAAEKPATTPAAQTREQKLVDAAKKEGGDVSLWVHDIGQQESLIGLFKTRYPFLTLKLWNSRGAEIMAKLSEEAKAGRPSCDVLIISSEIADAYSAGLLSEYEFPNVVGWTNQPKHNSYRIIGGTGRVVAYNTDLVPPADVPKTWDDVKSTKWSGKTFLSLSGEDSSLFWAYLWREGDKLNWDKSFSFWTDVIKNTKPKVVTGMTGPLGRLVAGEVPLFPAVSSNSVYRMQAAGAPLGIAGLGSVSGDAWGIALIKGAPHPNSARLLIDWLTSEEGLLAYSNSTQSFIVNPQLFAKSTAHARLKSSGMTWEALPTELQNSENLKKSSQFWMKALGVT